MAPTHQELDARSLAMHRLIAEKVRRDPSLFENVRATLARWRPTTAPGTLPYHEEWERLVSEGTEACLAVAVEDSERARALRQCSPFTGILTPEERLAFFDLSDEHLVALEERLSRPEVQDAIFPRDTPNRELLLGEMKAAVPRKPQGQ